MNLVDIVIVVGVLIALGGGSRRGFWLSLAQYLGLVFGVVVGATVASFTLDLLHVTSAASRSLGAVIVLVVLGTVGSSIGYWVGEPIRVRILARPGRGQLDSAGGAIFSALALLSVFWFLGLSFHGGPSPALAGAIEHSVILRRLDAIAPRPPAPLARVERILSGVIFPPVFSGLEPLLPPAQSVPSSANTPGILAARDVTVKVEGRGCGGIVFGSGFPVAPDEVVTNAHVVAGTSDTTVHSPNGQVRRAKVVLFDPDRDVAVLYVQGLASTPLGFAGAQPGTQGAAIGYPGGGSELVIPAVVDGEVQAEGRDIYGEKLVVRTIWILEAQVQPGIQPGNSGGPLVDRGGNVLGMIFAASTSRSNESYALTDTEIQPDLQQAAGRTGAVDVGPCAL